ncbi:uncharacterized protein DSM5745_10829 [Aspergillus mulundensis]|uniref:Uncharacterized protein n=1 Tax=Aspergillus mulundensis TaxID=1810919 RepID=A0A3D8QF93_9EURO|nr:Uncharacterized protein DSM5745_10829 [Aspergillus mulundensis]RDW60371.1 Uncharacterized protein DSM5745_10829 [Aspergillus mulundensis]
MEAWHRNVRLLHQIDEFLDIDSTQHFVADFIALIHAVREGLYVIDEDIRIPDSQINLHFLTKLKSRPEWKEWAMTILRDSRITASNLTDCMSFRELADLALKQERLLLQQRRTKRKIGSERRVSFAQFAVPQTPRSLTQEDINAFVVQEMRNQRESRRLSQMSHNPGHNARSHMKRPSQEEINDFVIQQMRRDQEQKAKARRSYSQPPKYSRNNLQSKPITTRCDFCGDTYHPSTNCWRRWRVAAEALQGHPPPKLIESRDGLFAQPRIYLSY